MKKYKWKSDNKIYEHIEKHILNKYNLKSFSVLKEVMLWKEKFDLKETDYVLLKRSREAIDSSGVFEKYKKTSNDVINESKNMYIFKSGLNYSCNYKLEDNLTTCLQLLFKEDKNDIRITSCFYRFNTVIDSSILVAAKYFLDHPVKYENYTFKQIYVRNDIFDKAVKKTFFDSYRKKPIELALSLISNYLLNQFEYYDEKVKKGEKDQKEYVYAKMLINKYRELGINEFEKKYLLNIIEENRLELQILQEQLFLPNELVECNSIFLRLCEISIIYDDSKYMEEAEKILREFNQS